MYTSFNYVLLHADWCYYIYINDYYILLQAITSHCKTTHDKCNGIAWRNSFVNWLCKLSRLYASRWRWCSFVVAYAEHWNSDWVAIVCSSTTNLPQAWNKACKSQNLFCLAAPRAPASFCRIPANNSLIPRLALNGFRHHNRVSVNTVWHYGRIYCAA